MLTEFELLIQELEFEMSVQDEELQEYLRFQDYKYAHYYQKGIWRIQRRIERLNRLNRNPASLDTHHLVDAIMELNDNQISSFSLTFVIGLDFYLHFHRLDNNSLYCQIPPESEMQRAHYYVYQPYMKKNILSLGFQLFHDSAGIEFSIEPDLSCDTILTKLAVLMFDILQIRTDASGYIEKKQVQ